MSTTEITDLSLGSALGRQINFGENQWLYSFDEGVEISRVGIGHWLKAKVMMPHQHGEGCQKSQVLADWVFIWRQEAEPGI